MSRLNKICFIDFETRARPGLVDATGDLKEDGTYRYVRSANAIINSYAINDEPVRVVARDADVSKPLAFSGMPADFRAFTDEVAAGRAVFCAFNAGFDRAVWNSSTDGFPYAPPEWFIDAMAQATASNLPPSLEGAAQALRLGGKQADGKALIQLFCAANGATPQEKPVEWARFKSYAGIDTEQLRGVYRSTRGLSDEEWEDYWASEEINERGMAVDVPMARAAAAVAVANKARLDAELTRWTNGRITAVTQAQRIAQWAYDMVEYAEARAILVREYDDEAEEDLKPAKLSLSRYNIEQLLVFYRARPELTDREKTLVNVLEARRYGGSSSPGKFQKIVDQHVDGRLRGQYVFNGAQQTGRFSSKGVQVHNLTRASLGKHEAEAIEMLNELEAARG